MEDRLILRRFAFLYGVFPGVCSDIGYFLPFFVFLSVFLKIFSEKSRFLRDFFIFRLT